MEVKGVALKIIPKYIRKKFGRDGLKNWLEAISPEAREVYSKSIDANKWYPVKTLLIEPTANIAQLFYKWDLKAAAWDCGRYSAEYGLTGVYRMFVKMGSHSFLIEKTKDLMPNYYNHSKMEISESNDGMVKLRITEFPEMDKTIEYRICGWIQRALEINGCINVEVEIVRSLTTNDPYTEIKVTWSGNVK
ncbi:MAG: hypothetical protein GY757_11840 [bacterium]|nr:hypothetical protein [bacterium]